MKRILAASLIGLGALCLSPLANAGVSLNIGIGLPGVVVGPPPVVYAPAPMYTPPPVVYAPRPYYGPPPPPHWHRPPPRDRWRH
jgi:hypothetical protein